MDCLSANASTMSAYSIFTCQLCILFLKTRVIFVFLQNNINYTIFSHCSLRPWALKSTLLQLILMLFVNSILMVSSALIFSQDLLHVSCFQRTVLMLSVLNNDGSITGDASDLSLLSMGNLISRSYTRFISLAAKIVSFTSNILRTFPVVGT